MLLAEAWCKQRASCVAGEGGECLINGLFIGNGRQHPITTLVEHASPHPAAAASSGNGILMIMPGVFTDASLSIKMHRKPTLSRPIATSAADDAQSTPSRNSKFMPTT